MFDSLSSSFSVVSKIQAKPPAAVPATVVMNNDAAVEDAEDFGSESSGEMKVRDQRYLEMMCWIYPRSPVG